MRDVLFCDRFGYAHGWRDVYDRRTASSTRNLQSQYKNRIYNVFWCNPSCYQCDLHIDEVDFFGTGVIYYLCIYTTIYYTVQQFVWYLYHVPIKYQIKLSVVALCERIVIHVFTVNIDVITWFYSIIYKYI